MSKKPIFYIILIIVILVLVFFSQQAVSGKFNQTLFSTVANQAQAYLAKGSNWVIDSIYPKISKEVQNGGEVIQNEVNRAKQKVAEVKEATENIPKKIESYFSGIKNAVTGNTNNNCTVPTTQTPTN
jgi:hypothetical protein